MALPFFRKPCLDRSVYTTYNDFTATGIKYNISGALVRENRESGENPERARHCMKFVVAASTREIGEGGWDVHFESGDLPEME